MKGKKVMHWLVTHGRWQIAKYTVIYLLITEIVWDMERSAMRKKKIQLWAKF
jgi:hypothetical protein